MNTFSTQELCIIAAVQLIIGGISVLVWRRYFSPLSDIPGPFLASLSRLWQIKHIVSGDHNVEFIALHKRLGHFVRIAPNEVSVSHPDGIKKVLLAPLEKAPWYKSQAIPDYRFQTPHSETDPKRKMARSKNFASGYTVSNLIQNETHIDGMIDLLLGWMDKFADSGEPMNLGLFFTFTSSDIMGELLFSQPFGFLEEGKDIGNAIANSGPLNAYAGIMGFFGWAHTLAVGNPLITWLGVLPMGHLYDHAVQAIDRRLANQDARFDLISHWSKALERNPDGMTVRDIYAKATTDVGAGLDTVAVGLSSFVYHMLRHPDAWRRAREEIEEARRTRGLCGDRIVSYEDALQLPFLQACVKEAVRVFAPACFPLSRVAPAEGVKIGDRYFPKGTILSINPWVMHYSTEIWGPDAAEFKPDRWMKSEDVAVMDKYFIPWGTGYQSCPGLNIAKIELSKIAAVLVRDYDIRQVNEGTAWKWKAYVTVVPHSWDCYIKKASSQVV